MSKKFIIYGEFWEGTLPYLLSQELNQRGYSVFEFDFSEIMPGIKNRNLFGRISRNLFSCWYDWKINATLVKATFSIGPQHIIVCKGLNIWPQTLKKLSNAGFYLINWNPDDFFNIKNTNKNLISSIKYYDLVVSSRPHLFDEYLDFGAKRMIFIDWYYVSNIHFPRTSSKIYNITFVGSWSKYREDFISEIECPVEIWGSGWENSSGSFKKFHKVHMKILSQREMCSVFSASKYNLNLITHENRDLSNLRFFEISASRGLLITERNSSSLSYLADGIECLMYDSPNDVNKIIKKALDLDAISNMGHIKITNSGNSFADRVTELLNAVE
jgi:spore maturation protein CgeB